MNFYAYQKIVGKIKDNSDLREEFIRLFDTKSKEDLVRFCLSYAQELLKAYPYACLPVMTEGFQAMQDWLDGKVNYHAARNLSFELNRQIREEKDLVKKRFYQTISQLLASPHVKFHALWASDFAITLVNRSRPDDIEAVTQERQKQIGLLNKVTTCSNN